MILNEINALVKSAAAVFSKKPRRVAKTSVRPDQTPSNHPGIRQQAATPAVYQKPHAPLKVFNKEDFQSVYDFYRDVAPAIRMRELGVSSLPKTDLDVFNNLSNIPVSFGDIGDRSGVHRETADGKGSKEIILSDTRNKSDAAARSALAHELRHALARKFGNNERSSGKLNRILGFLGVDISPKKPGYAARYGNEEMFTTIKEHQYREYEKLRNMLKRAPTAAEYFEHIDKLQPSQLYNNRKSPVNGYQEIADKVRGFFDGRRLQKGWLDAYRDALKSVSRYMRPQAGGWAAFAPGKQIA